MKIDGIFWGKVDFHSSDDRRPHVRKQSERGPQSDRGPHVRKQSGFWPVDDTRRGSCIFKRREMLLGFKTP